MKTGQSFFIFKGDYDEICAILNGIGKLRIRCSNMWLYTNFYRGVAQPGESTDLISPGSWVQSPPPLFEI